MPELFPANKADEVNIIGSGDVLQVNGSAYFEDCLIEGDGDSFLGRGPAFFRNCRIDCALSGISPAGWGEIGGDTSNIHYWEYRSRNLEDGKPVDVRLRHPASRQLDGEKDAVTIKNYPDPAFVLGEV